MIYWAVVCAVAFDAVCCSYRTSGGGIYMIGKRLGQGNTAEVYAWGKDRVIKLFRHSSFDPWMEKEYQLSLYVSQLGLPVPRVFGIEEVKGKRGIVFERLEGHTQIRQLVSRPWSARAEGRRLAEWHAVIHQEQGESSMPKRKLSLQEAIEHTSLLSAAEKSAILKRLAQLPEQDALCHGDFHPDNLMMTSRGPVILDWMTATSGHPYSDAARTVLLLTHAVLPSSMPKLVKLMITRLRAALCQAYKERYMEMTGATEAELQAWELPLAAARLVESVPAEEKQVLLGVIRRSLQK
ncbi:aminoglycoside phosphotransferase family protein [Paenibacillus sp. GD4]|uniref:aminoglycoside phosphotransferase family protein n=1 Tax=Paenibacillus sp. GD4 TaxID=3068890 RepID=UPI002796B1BD|nr:aminoglycoside phosphotransferase family protein [Paenibacillus sp. GD4]MDQ1910665.1 aminoglycoside phosphotransferase family protein [Paenibacillus sp. GD4]